MSSLSDERRLPVNPVKTHYAASGSLFQKRTTTFWYTPLMRISVIFRRQTRGWWTEHSGAFQPSTVNSTPSSLKSAASSYRWFTVVARQDSWDVPTVLYRLLGYAAVISGQLQPTTIKIDCEAAVIIAVRDVLPSTTHRLCYFHFC